ncbi:unnamed protein product [Commensalibacter communis]|uniref:Knr4/Smi1-like domain-containing protein n=1 Tax=Commensalibacter communis TaxID=2972786 RepID=A0A9W4TKR1_9PROT|nr:SMI1/KNR4 family protein [Commensalibacter communis]CAI3926680.1 unnamed protein product [Commensalibacter communis]CAI3928192.1 unnamed protein product [Commensalibacter communis]CAI3928438.1 unnamed protein product [Commensalibacter communis]CAI3934306.1 unnamed protein product [Commensalibacter communis]CAI3934820.1 unnamed protein product [Commensalibacter communis]
MDLQAINPIVYNAWLQRKNGGSRYYTPSTIEQLQQIEDRVGCHLPADFTEFMLKYSCVAPTPKNKCSCFKVDYVTGAKLGMIWGLVDCAKSIIDATAFYHETSPYNDEIGPRLPKSLLPLTRSEEAALLIDLRPESFGNILYHPDLTYYTFGTDLNDWWRVGYVAPTFTDMLKELNTEEVICQRYNLQLGNYD